MQLNWSRSSVDSSGLLRSLCPCRSSSLPPIMSVGRLLRPPRGSRSFGGCGTPGQSKIEGSERRMGRAPSSALSSCPTSNRIPKSLIYISRGDKRFSCNSFARPDCVNNVTKLTAVALARSHDILHRCPLLFQLIPAVSIIAFAVWGFEPVLLSGNLHHKNDANWKKSRMHHVLISCLRPVILCIGVILMCRALDPISLASESSQAVKQRFLNFVRSLATVLAFAFCSSSMIEQMQKFYAEQMPSSDSRSMGFQFTGKAIYTAMWVAALSLFMELLGFSTQKWLTAGGLGTVLLTLAGREIFTNFLSSLMIHATRPFVVNDWIQTKIEGYEVSGTVERVGWWSPTIIRGEDQEAVHIPNHKFSVNVVRNLSQKTHWRIKTHLAISHLDAKKISNIVADMRKVLAKNPQIEQQRIHRRIFLDYIDTENQAFMILVSCFVRTSYFEEYLCVKEAVLLDLLRVIGHHGARLATPIRTVNKTYSDPDLDDMPFADTTFTRRRHSLFLPEILSRINGDEKPRGHYTPILSKEQPSSTAGESERKDTSTMEVVSSGDSLSTNGGIATVISKDRDLQNQVNDGVMAEKKTQSASRSETELLTGVSEMVGSKATDACIGAVKEMAPSNHLGNEQRVSDISPMTAQAQQETERSHFKPPPVSRSLENNIILGVALDGAKRTLPIEEQLTKELVACKNGSELSPLPMDKQDAQTTAGGMLTEQGRG